MLKLNRYLLVALSIVAVNMGPMQVQAKNTTPKANERKTNRNQENQVKDFDRVKREIRIMGDKKQRAPIEQALQTIYNTKVGKDLLDRVPLKGLTIKFANLPQGKYGIFFPSQKTIRLSNRLSLSNSGSEVLFHELRHYAQLCEGRNNLHNRGDGIEGYVDFATAKLCEVEANLFDSIYLAEISPYKSDRISQRQRSQYYQELEKKYRGQTQNEDEAARLARTEYVQTLWETSKCKTGGPESFSHWINNYNQNFINWSLQAPVGKRDIQKEYDMMQGYIKSMDINLDVAYFLNTENWHLSKEVQQIFDKRERKCKKKGTCLDLCTPKANENAKHPPK